MADDTSATILHLHQPKKAPMSGAERARMYRLRKRQQVSVPAHVPERAVIVTPVTVPPKFVTINVTPSRRHAGSILITTAAFGLALVGVTMNGWFARSLGSSDVSGWLFLGIGVAADLVALAAPSCASRLWQAKQRATALAGWGVWIVAFAFAVTAGIGFASVNITDVTSARASRVTPAVDTARAAVADAVAARDRECAGGVGKFCRQREETLTDRRKALDVAMKSVEQTADPQTEAAVRIVAWLSGGILKPTGDDFAMLRLVLLALLPQIGGILLMIGKTNTVEKG